MTRILGDLFNAVDVEKVVLAFGIYLILGSTTEDLTDKANYFADTFQKWFIDENPLNIKDEKLHKEAEWKANTIVPELDNYIKQVDWDVLFKAILKK